jgi:DNA polymerase III subunit epsilon
MIGRKARRDLRRQPWGDAEYWALDLEMSGLDPGRDSILAVGMVPVRARAVRVGEGYATLVAAPEPMSMAGLPAHQLMPAQLADAPQLAHVVEQIARRLGDSIVVVHAGQIDLPFLRRAFAAASRPWPEPPVIDTLRLLARQEQHRLAQLGSVTALPARLGAARSLFGLPPHEAHDAFGDAVATAELFLVLAHRLGARTVGDLL